MITLRELLTDSRDGEWGQGDYFPGSVQSSVIRGTDFASARMAIVDKVPVRFLEERHFRRKVLLEDDIILETAGGTKDQPTGRTVFVTRNLLNALPYPAICASFARFLRIDASRANPRFVFWLLQDLYERRQILKYHTQHTGVARFQFTTFADTYGLILPDRKQQDRIANILSAYDDLVEVNQRRIAILEDMARRLFDEWFVKFRYPGHGFAQLIEIDGVLQPLNWDRTRLGNVLRLDYGKALKSEHRRAGSVPVFGSSGVVGTHDFALVRGPGIIVGRKGNVGSIHWSAHDFYPIDTVFFVQTALPLRWVAQLLKRQTFLNSDAAVPGLNREQAYSMEVILPPRPLIDRYATWVEPLLHQAEMLDQSNTRLRAARDLLLPKLMSGEIELGQAEQVFAQAAE